VITVTGSKRHTGKAVPLRKFRRDESDGNWVVDLNTAGSITTYLERGDDPDTAADKVVSAIMSQRHGRLASDGTVWRFGKTAVPVIVMNVVLNAIRSAGLISVQLDDIKDVQTHNGSDIKKLIGLSADARKHAENALYAVILQRCSTLG